VASGRTPLQEIAPQKRILEAGFPGQFERNLRLASSRRARSSGVSDAIPPREILSRMRSTSSSERCSSRVLAGLGVAVAVDSVFSRRAKSGLLDFAGLADW